MGELGRAGGYWDALEVLFVRIPAPGAHILAQRETATWRPSLVAVSAAP